MTAIAGFAEQGGRVWIGGDSAAASGYDLIVRADPKVFIAGDFVMGFTSSFRMGQLLRYSLYVPKPKEGQDAVEYMCTTFINSVRDCLRLGGYARRTNEEESGGTFLVGFRGRLFEVGADYQVGESSSGYAACGCGAPYVLGALFAMAGMQIDPHERIKIALAAAESHNGGVRAPFVVESLPS